MSCAAGAPAHPVLLEAARFAGITFNTATPTPSTAESDENAAPDSDDDMAANPFTSTSCATASKVTFQSILNWAAERLNDKVREEWAKLSRR